MINPITSELLTGQTTVNHSVNCSLSTMLTLLKCHCLIIRMLGPEQTSLSSLKYFKQQKWCREAQTECVAVEID